MEEQEVGEEGGRAEREEGGEGEKQVRLELLKSSISSNKRRRARRRVLLAA